MHVLLSYMLETATDLTTKITIPNGPLTCLFSATSIIVNAGCHSKTLQCHMPRMKIEKKHT